MTTVLPGSLAIKINTGVLKRNTEMFGKMSPYCTVVFNGKKLKTKVHKNGGKTPKWDDRF